MKRFLLFVLLIAGISACKKSKKADQITPDTLLGTWQEQLPVYSSALPVNYIFRGDSTFTKHVGGFIGIEQGTYQTKPVGSTPGRILDVTLTGSITTPRAIIEIKSSNQIVITYGGTMGKNFVRQP